MSETRSLRHTPLREAGRHLRVVAEKREVNRKVGACFGNSGGRGTTFTKAERKWGSGQVGCWVGGRCLGGDRRMPRWGGPWMGREAWQQIPERGGATGQVVLSWAEQPLPR